MKWKSWMLRETIHGDERIVIQILIRLKILFESVHETSEYRKNYASNLYCMPTLPGLRSQLVLTNSTCVIYDYITDKNKPAYHLRTKRSKLRGWEEKMKSSCLAILLFSAFLRSLQQLWAGLVSVDYWKCRSCTTTKSNDWHVGILMPITSWILT